MEATRQNEHLRVHPAESECLSPKCLHNVQIVPPSPWSQQDLGLRILAAAREAVAMHVDQHVRDGVEKAHEIAVERTQAASLAILAERVKAARLVAQEVAS